MKTGGKFVIVLSRKILRFACLLVVVALSLGSFEVVAFELKGVWVVDVDRTKAFNQERLKLGQLETNILNCLVDEWIFTPVTRSIGVSSGECYVDNRNVLIEQYSEEYTYRVLGRTADSALLETILHSGAPRYDILHFDGEGSFWYYDSGEDNNIHMRLYFKKVPEKG